MENINAETVRAAVNESNPVLEALSILLGEVSRDAVSSLAGVLGMVGVPAETLPGEYLLQSILVEAEKVFKHITRERWIDIYDSYQQVKAVIDANPDLKDEVAKKHDADREKLLDGNF